MFVRVGVGAYFFAAVLLSAVPSVFAQEPSAQLNLSAALQELRAVAHGYPPKFDGPEHRVAIENKWRLVEAGVRAYVDGKSEPDANGELLIGDIYRMGYNLDIDDSGEKAIEHLTRAAELDPRNPNPLHLLGRHYTYSAEEAAGELALLQAYALAGAEQGTPILFDLIWNAYLQKRFPQTMLLADRYLSVHPEDAAILAIREYARQAVEEGREIRTIEVPAGVANPSPDYS